MEIPPGDSAEVVFTLGATTDEAEALALADKYREPAAARRELSRVKTFWGEMTDRLAVELSLIHISHGSRISFGER